MIKLFSVYDSKVKAYRFPFFMQSTGQAIRAFTDLVNDGGKSEVAKYPEDFSLFDHGSFDDQTGEMSCSNAVNLGLAANFKR